ncbi:MAG: GDP-mannose 4,6-dehydratase [Kiritimatiellae bacterium]|nr:GDP-mannose 4,6-dehydratase [Kiritimatiellia bacterium]
MRVLLTGAAGFVAPYVARELEARGHEVFATDVAPSRDGYAHYAQCDISSADAVRDLVRCAAPDACVHLAGISFVPDAAKNPGLLYAVNVGGTINLLDALSGATPPRRFLFISTAQAYGCTQDPADAPVGEDAPLYPLSPYAISKVAGEAATRAYGKYRGLASFVARPSNHTGPGQTVKFVAPSFVAQAREILSGSRDRFTTGNLDSGRDFSDVRDVASAYVTVLEKGRPGETYNVSSGERHRIAEILGIVRRVAGVSAPAETSADLWRPTDFSRLLDVSRLRALGWAPRHSLEGTIRDMFGA